MFKSFATRIQHAISKDKADWMRALGRDEKFYLLSHRIGQTVLDAARAGMNLRGAYLLVSSSGHVSLSLYKCNINGNEPIACIPFWHSKLIQEYIAAFSNKNIPDSRFQIIQNCMGQRLAASVLNAIYGESYIELG